MNKILSLKKIIYGKFSDDFFQKKSEVEEIEMNLSLIKRPYKGEAKDIAEDIRGIESVFYITCGLFGAFYFASGAFALKGRVPFKPLSFIAFSITINVLCDIIKVFYVHKKHEKTIKSIIKTYAYLN